MYISNTMETVVGGANVVKPRITNLLYCSYICQKHQWNTTVVQVYKTVLKLTDCSAIFLDSNSNWQHTLVTFKHVLGDVVKKLHTKISFYIQPPQYIFFLHLNIRTDWHTDEFGIIECSSPQYCPINLKVLLCVMPLTRSWWWLFKMHEPLNLYNQEAGGRPCLVW